MEIPINTRVLNNQLVAEFDTDKDIGKWKQTNNLPEDINPVESIIKLINDDKNIIRKVIDNPLSRLLTYELMKEKGLAGNIILEDFTITFEEEYLQQKRSLIKAFSEVTMKSSAKEDFINIFKNVSLNNFLDRVIYKDNDNKEIIIPGKILLDMIKEKNDKVPIDVQLTGDNNSVIYKYIGDIDIEETNLIELTIDYANKAGVIDDFIISDEIRSLAQVQLLNDGVNPKISIAKDFEYTAINNLKNWYTEKNINKDSSIKDSFLKLKDNYEIEESLSKYEIGRAHV